MAALAVLLAVAGCRGERPEPPAAESRKPESVGTERPRFELGGCDEVLGSLSGAEFVCHRAEDAALVVRLWTTESAAHRVVLDGREQRVEPLRFGDTVALTVPLPAGTETVAIRPPSGAWVPPLRVSVAPIVADSELQGASADELKDLIAKRTEAADRARAGSALARALRRAGHYEDAVTAFENAESLHISSENASAAAYDAVGRAWTQRRYLGQLDAARQSLAMARERGAVDGAASAQLAYHAALVERDALAWRAAYAWLQAAEHRASALGLANERSYAVQVRASMDSRLGRHREAATAMDGLRTWAASQGSACEKAAVYNNAGWYWLLAADAAPGHRGDQGAARLQQAADRLAEAYALAQRSCADSSVHGHALANLATLAIRTGEPEVARARLDAMAELSGRAVDAEARAWGELLRGEVALLEKRYPDAVSAFEAVRARAQAAAEPALEWDALVGLARALRAQGQGEAAVAPLQAAEALLDGLTALVPIDSGRSSFSGDRESSAVLLTDTLVELGRAEEALGAARRARSRAIRRLFARDRVGSMPAGERKAFESALSRYRAARKELEAEASDDWQRPADELARTLASRRQTLVALRADLEAALERVAGSATRSPSVRPLLPGAVELMYFPSNRGWRGYARTSGGVQTTLIGEPLGEGSAAALLAPFADVLQQATRVEVLEYGAVRGLDIHAASVGGRPLVHQAPVVFALDAPAGPGTTAAAPVQRRAFGLVADPRGDLPAARQEFQAVKTQLTDRPGISVRGVVGTDARRAAVMELMAESEWFHFAGHGEFGGPFGWESRLLLADGGELSVSDVLALPKVPKTVVLSGCETGRSTASKAESVSLSTAFVAAGAHYAVATSRPIDDALATEFAQGLYATGPLIDPAAAYRRALRALPPGSDWPAFRLYVR